MKLRAAFVAITVLATMGLAAESAEPAHARPASRGSAGSPDRFPGSHPTPRLRSSGVYVAHAQGILDCFTSMSLSVDGIFGSKTREAVMGMQAWCRASGNTAVVVDGIVGPVTWA